MAKSRAAATPPAPALRAARSRSTAGEPRRPLVAPLLRTQKPSPAPPLRPRSLPKFVGRPTGPGHTKTEYEIIKVSALNQLDDGAEVDYAALLAARAVSKSKRKLNKVVGAADKLTVKNLKVRAHAFTSSARAEIEALGGSCIELSPTTGEPVAA